MASKPNLQTIPEWSNLASKNPIGPPHKPPRVMATAKLVVYVVHFIWYTKSIKCLASEILELITDDNSITRIQPFLETTNLFEKLNIELTIFKILGYGGGLFLPFFDKGCFSNGENYEGGRYLIDTIKGADLGECKKNELRLDFNFSYNPSCSYNSKWSCPIIKNYNRIPFFLKIVKYV